MGCCPWGRTESDTTEATWHACMHWKGNGNPGTEEPGGLPSMGSQSRTRLKRLSSSSLNGDISHTISGKSSCLFSLMMSHYIF